MYLLILYMYICAYLLRGENGRGHIFFLSFTFPDQNDHSIPHSCKSLIFSKKRFIYI